MYVNDLDTVLAHAKSQGISELETDAVDRQ